MSIFETIQKPSAPPCKYEDIVLYYSETANLYCEPFEEFLMVKNFYDMEGLGYSYEDQGDI